MQNTHKIHTYTIDDHPDPEKVCDWIRNHWHDLYCWQAENNDSLNGFAEFFNVSIKDWSIDPCGPSHCEFDAAEFGLDNINRYEYMDNPLRGVRLWKYLKAHGYDQPESCGFTGYCADEWLLDPIRKFIERPDTTSTMQDLCDEAGANWAKVYLEDWEHTYTDEAITENCEANQYEFTEDGQFWN